MGIGIVEVGQRASNGEGQSCVHEDSNLQPAEGGLLCRVDVLTGGGAIVARERGLDRKWRPLYSTL